MAEYPTAESIVWCYNEVKLGKVFVVTAPWLLSYPDKANPWQNLESLNINRTFVLCDASCIDIINDDGPGQDNTKTRVEFKILLGSQIRYIQTHPHDFNIVRESNFFKELV